MPVARGQWVNDTQHFQLLVFTPIHFELSIYRTDIKIVEIYRFTKTQVPQMEDVLKAMIAPVSVGLVFIVINLFKVHQYIKEEEEKEALMRIKKEQESREIAESNKNESDNQTSESNSKEKAKKD